MKRKTRFYAQQKYYNTIQNESKEKNAEIGLNLKIPSRRSPMKICGVICEYNPFHLGHEYQLREAKKRSGADAVVCVMSRCFTQRGEAAILPPALRAKHAVLCGARSSPCPSFFRRLPRKFSRAARFDCFVRFRGSIVFRSARNTRTAIFMPRRKF